MAMALVTTATVLGIPVDAANAAPATHWTRCDGGEGDVNCVLVRGIAGAPASAQLPGALYIASQGNKSIEEFTAWGEFKRRWGWNVVESGPDESGSGFEICVPASGDVCKTGVAGGGAGQFGEGFGPQGIAVDSAANVYVVDRLNHRVQQFSSTGQFLRMWGKGVNTGTGNPDLCTSAGPPTDICGVGTEGTGNGQFGEWVSLGTYVAADTKGTPSVADDKIYVGDKGRIQVFNTTGEYQSQIVEGLTASDNVKSLAVDKAGNLYAAIEGKNNVRKWNASGIYQGEKITVSAPVALAADAADKANNLYVLSGSPKTIVAKFSPANVKLEEWGQEEPPAPKLSESTGIAANSACLPKGTDVYVTNPGPVFARAYGPEPTLCEKPEVAPSIFAQYAVSVGAFTATLQAQIHPHFYADTTYYVQYATAACINNGGWKAACVKSQPNPPGTILGTGGDLPLTTGAILLGGLSPDTEYRFRFAAQSGGSGQEPVFGVGGKVGIDGVAAAFHTFAEPPSGSGSCANALFRLGAAASLLDCRAYEMVSPVEKEGADIRGGFTPTFNAVARNQSALTGERLTYSAAQPFGSAVSQPFLSQYIATRRAGGWSTEAISPPRGVLRGSAASGADNEFKAFTADLCGSWLVNDDTTAPPLAPGGLEQTNNLYHRDNCGGGGYKALGWGKLNTNVDPLELQGVALDGSRATFRAEAQLSQEAATQVGVQLRCSTPEVAEAISYRWLRNGAVIPGETKAEHNVIAADAGDTIQCQVTAKNANAGATGINNPAWVIDPYPETAPPRAPQAMSAPVASALLKVGGTGGQTLHCDAGKWGGAPTFEYQWYRNGGALESGEDIAHGSQTDTYTVQSADLGSAAVFQCVTIASNSGGTVVASSKNATTDPAPSGPAAPTVQARGVANRAAMVYLAGGEELRPVCILPGGKTASPGCSAGLLAAPLVTGYGTNLSNAVSAAGTRVYWTADAGLGFGGPGKIYLRENADQVQSALDGEGRCSEAGKACTTTVSAVNAQFWTASKDGSRAIYRTGTLSETGTLYEFDAASGKSRKIAGGVWGLLGASEDVSRLYLVSTETQGGDGVAGQANLYLYKADSSSFTFIATLPDRDVNLEAGPRIPSPVSAIPSGHAARVSADGGAAAFVSSGQLTGYDNSDAASGEADREVFLYRLASGELECVSCNPSGARPVGRHVEEDGKKYWAAAEFAGAEHPLYFPRNLAENGTRLFFESYEPLVLSDTNGQRDVYQWEAVGEGNCEQGSGALSPLAGGCVSLISAGESTHDSEFTDASPSGDDVFIRTASSLIASDPGQFDIYDARVGGGFPQPQVKPPCEGDACQGLTAAPEVLTPASSAFRGAGNLKARKKCPKSKRLVRRGGKARCVRKRHRRHVKQHKRGHSHNGRAQR